MAAPLVIAGDTRVRLLYSTQIMRDVLEPFIVDVATRLKSTRNLKDSVTAAAEKMPDAARYFVMDQNVEESFALKNEFLFGNWSPEQLEITKIGTDHRYTIDLTDCEDELPALQHLLSGMSSGTHTRTSLRRDVDGDMNELLETMIAAKIVVEQRRPMQEFAPDGVAGVYRLQHASLLYRTEKHGVLVDPHIHSTYLTVSGEDIYRDQLHGKVDAILISHFHEDHWFLSSLMMFPREIPIIVPKVPRSTVICGDMVSMLRRCGFANVIALDWYSEPITIGDIEVHVLPFYGEQPLRFDAPKDPDIRNWGNTYVIRTNQYVSWFLIDSGSDRLGSMIDVAVHVKKTFGRVDFLLSNLRPFYVYSPLYINGGLNWLTLSPRQLLNFPGMAQDCITLGPNGVADICQIVEPRCYLPYAHWFGELGHLGDISLDTPGQSERKLLHMLAEHLKERGLTTEIVPWMIGDGFVRRLGGGFDRRPIRPH